MRFNKFMSQCTNSTFRGQTLVEVLIAMGVAVIVMTAMTTAVLTSLNNAQYSKLQNQATQYAQQGMEVTQSYRDAMSLTALTGGGSKCMMQSCSPATVNFDNCFLTITPPATCALIESIFERRVTVSNDAAKCGGSTRLVSVAVSWNDGKCTTDARCHKVEVNSCMADSFRPGL